MSVGFQYIAYESRASFQKPLLYANETLRSIKSLRKFTDLPIHIRTDVHDFFEKSGEKNLEVTYFEKSEKDYSQVTTWEDYRKENKGRLFKTYDKLYLLKDLPYDFTFCVDSDTVFLDNPEALISEDFDLQICKEVHWDQDYEDGIMFSALTDCINTGFCFFKGGENYEKMMSIAIDSFENPQKYSLPGLSTGGVPAAGDQYYVNYALNFMLDFKIKLLPLEWNVRIPLFNKVENPKLLHGRNGRMINEVLKRVGRDDLLI